MACIKKCLCPPPQAAIDCPHSNVVINDITEEEVNKVIHKLNDSNDIKRVQNLKMLTKSFNREYDIDTTNNIDTIKQKYYKLLNENIQLKYDNIQNNKHGSENRIAMVKKLHNEPGYIKSQLKIEAYKKRITLMLSDVEERNYILNLKYVSYNFKIQCIQISIILLSTVSALLQGSTQVFNILPETITFFGLFISAYTSFTLSVSKYMNYDERKEETHYLRKRFAEFLVKVQILNNELELWSTYKFWADVPIQTKVAEWIHEEKEIMNLIEKLVSEKQELCSDFEKILDAITQKKYKERAAELRVKKYNRMLLFDNKNEQNMIKQNESLIQRNQELQSEVNLYDTHNKNESDNKKAGCFP